MAETQTKLPIKTGAKTGMSPMPAAGAPWQPFDSLRREIDGLFENLGLGSWRLPAERGLKLGIGWPGGMAGGLAPAVDLAEKDNAYEITAELPGLDEKDVEVKLADGLLTIKGEKREQREEKDKDYHLSERRYGSFIRAFALPAGIDTDKIDARFAKGVLTVSLPKTVEAQQKEKKIDVKPA